MKKIYFIGNYKIEGVDNYATLNYAKDYLLQQEEIGLDIETTRKYSKYTYSEEVYQGGLDPYLSKVVMIQLGTLEKIFVIDVRCFSKKVISEFLKEVTNRLCVIHNAKFEGKHLNHNYRIRLENVWDTMLCEINLTNGLPLKYGLAHLAERYLGVKKDSELSLFDSVVKNKEISLNDAYLQKHDYVLTPFEVEDNFFIDKSTRLQFVTIGDKPFTKEQVLYGADDIEFPLLIKQRQQLGRKLPSGEVYNPVKCHEIENKFSQVLAEIELNGLGFDKEKWIEIAEKNEKLFVERKNKLDEYIVKHYPEFALLDLFNPIPMCNVDWASSKSTINFFKKLGICPKERSKTTKKIEYTVGAKAFLKVLPAEYKNAYMYNSWQEFKERDNNILITNYLLLKKTEQAITTFGRDWVKNVHPITGRVHSGYRQILNTSRISSVNPNLQNISGGDYRNCFIAKEGNKMINCDYGAQEMRVVAEISGDEEMYKFFVEGNEIFGDDFHSFTATKTFKLVENDPDLFVPPKEINGKKHPDFNEVANKRRNAAKAIGFKINYGKKQNCLV